MEEGWSCSDCAASFPVHTVLHGCRQCDFDLCESCLKRRAPNDEVTSQVRLPAIAAETQSGTPRTVRQAFSPEEAHKNCIQVCVGEQVLVSHRHDLGWAYGHVEGPASR